MRSVSTLTPISPSFSDKGPVTFEPPPAPWQMVRRMLWPP